MINKIKVTVQEAKALSQLADRSDDPEMKDLAAALRHAIRVQEQGKAIIFVLESENGLRKKEETEVSSLDIRGRGGTDRGI